MLFNSLTFWLFFAAFLLAWWCVRDNLRARNLLVLSASYFFYGWWDVRFLALIWFSTALDYGVGWQLARTDAPSARRFWIACSVVGNLGVLGFFKYWNFFQDSAIVLLQHLGFQPHPFTLQIVLPVGISFYTFQTMSYTLDVYRREMDATRDWLSFSAYVAFFPQLVAGPIERARNLLPQFQRTRIITRGDVVSGLDLMVWGLFKKVVVADSIAPFVDTVFALPAAGIALTVCATVIFGFQIYCDFSGYSDIARGLARVLGFNLMVNFDRPYAASSLSEFWRRWHISLSTWLRDYCYIALGGNRGGIWRVTRNLWITMLLGGLWHGASWNFVWWGGWHALGLTLEHAWRHKRGPRAMPGGSWWTLGWVFSGWYWFRGHANGLEWAAWNMMPIPGWAWDYLWWSVGLIVPLLWAERWQARHGPPGEAPASAHRLAPWISGVLLFITISMIQDRPAPFVYFQF